MGTGPPPPPPHPNEARPATAVARARDRGARSTAPVPKRAVPRITHITRVHIASRIIENHRVNTVVTVDALVDGRSSHRRGRRTGLRAVTLDNWVLAVNGERLFVKGARQGPARHALAEVAEGLYLDRERAAGGKRGDRGGREIKKKQKEITEMETKLKESQPK